MTAIVAGGLIYTFNGFQTIVAYEVKLKIMVEMYPLAIILALVLVLALYLGLQYGFMQAVPH